MQQDHLDALTHPRPPDSLVAGDHRQGGRELPLQRLGLGDQSYVGTSVGLGDRDLLMYSPVRAHGQEELGVLSPLRGPGEPQQLVISGPRGEQTGPVLPVPSDLREPVAQIHVSVDVGQEEVALLDVFPDPLLLFEPHAS
uniref:Uncharacterized protein n=1 Tax=Nanobsidianus stetteri TaxID=1294122 RepID=A0A2T9WL05_NANST